MSNTTAPLSRLIAQSDLVALMSEASLAGPNGQGLAPLPFAEARLSRAIGVVTRKHHPLPPLAVRLIEILQKGKAQSASRKTIASRTGG
ncbi:hypothetical protein [Ottowia sp. VDI28]|uniref:hypothetical protein n=1 Tax=Ottowia sp. VDI28 TaxID=3133968 RepID=UPI003C2E2DE3